MASEVKLNFMSVTMNLIVWIILLGLVKSQKVPRLDILPSQQTQRKPVGKPLLLTCRPHVPDTSLLSDLRWSDNRNMTILPKAAGQATPAMYTETLPSDQSLALIFPSMQESMAGMYYCSASYSITEQLNVGVEIDTYVAITWKDAPENQFPILGSDYTVKCEVTANPPATVDWLRNGDPIKSGGRYIVEMRGLLIKSVQEADDGIYTCRAVVIPTGELVERNIRVEVQIKPNVDKLPLIMDAVEGQSFSTICNATGKPVPEYSWIKKSTQQNVATADRFTVNALTGQLSINRVEQEDYDTYTCVAKNAAGISESTTKLNVLVRPKIYEFINITVAQEEEAVFVCKSFGRPPPEITFRRFGTQEEYTLGLQSNDDRIVLEQSVSEESGESVGSLRITKLLRSDDGLYECVARNRGDVAYKVGHITVEYPPNFDNMKTLPPAFSWEERRANLSCLAQGFPNATIEWRWQDRLIKDLYDRNLVIEGTGPRSNLLITPAGQKYYSSYKCIAVNRLGRAEHSMQLREAKVPEVLAQSKPRIVTATTITFDLIGPSVDLGMPITAYYVQYNEERDMDWNNAFNRTWSPDSPYIVEGLKPQTSYKFRFAARNLVGLGRWGAAIFQSTPKRSAPEEPRTLHAPIQEGSEDDGDAIVTSPYADHFELRWNIPADNGEPIDVYQVKYCPGAKVTGVWNELAAECIERDISAIESTSFEMRDLQADTYYRIELRAHNAIGYSTPAHLLLKTARGIDVVLRVDSPALSSSAVIGIVVGSVLLILCIIDILCCLIGNLGLLAIMCRKTKRSPSDLDEETKLGREDEKQPLNTPTGSMKKNSSVEFDGKVVHSRSGEIIGKNSSV